MGIKSNMSAFFQKIFQHKNIIGDVADNLSNPGEIGGIGDFVKMLPSSGSEAKALKDLYMKKRQYNYEDSMRNYKNFFKSNTGRETANKIMDSEAIKSMGAIHSHLKTISNLSKKTKYEERMEYADKLNRMFNNT